MSSGTAKDYETYARDLVRLAQQPNAPPELREQLLGMARLWMAAVMDAEKVTEGHALSTTRPLESLDG